MSLPEVIPSNLPQFVMNKARSNFSNSVVPSGSVLLFAESDGSGGSKLIAKNPDGSFTEVGGGGSMNFYKCASVGTGTWTGYLASVDPVTGVWSFASTATSGLTYTYPVPVAGRVYAGETCLCEASDYNTGLPVNGLVFYLALADEIGEKDDTGAYSLTFYNTNYSFGSRNGIPCMVTGDIVKITGPDFGSLFPDSSSARFTVSFWAASTDTYGIWTGGGFIKFAEANNVSMSLGAGVQNEQNGKLYREYDGRGWELISSDNNSSQMSHYAFTYNGAQVKYYKNGEQVGFFDTSKPFNRSDIYPGIIGRSGGYITGFRIYNRVLDSSEISALAAEFSPTA